MTVPKRLLSCSMCPMKNDCFRASDMGATSKAHPEWMSDWVRGQLWKRRRETPEMKAGTEAHKMLESMRGVETNPQEVIRRLRDRESFWGTLGICSVRYGWRGTPDAVHFQWHHEWSQQWRTTLKITVLDDKTHYDPAYLRQLDVYSLILTDPYCLYTSGSFSDDEDLAREPFFEAIGYDGDVEVLDQFNFYRVKPDGVDSHLQNAMPFSAHRIIPRKNQWRYYGISRAKEKLRLAKLKPELLAASRQYRFSKRTGELLEPRA